MSLNFDSIDPDSLHLDGAVSVTVLDKDLTPNHVLERDLPWSIKIDWFIKGVIAPAIGGDWLVTAYLESMGGGFEGQVGPAISVPVSFAPPTHLRKYTATISVPAGVPTQPVPPQSRAYMLTVTVTHSNTGGGVTLQDKMAGFSEGPLLQFYNPQV
jgi:hypothetical protein